MSLIHKFELLAEGKSGNIGIGLGSSELHNQKILIASKNFLKKFSSRVYIFGNKDFINQIKKGIPSKYDSKIFFIESFEPEKDIFDYLEKNTINAIVRGSLSSSKFLVHSKNYLNLDTIKRLALLETVNRHQFFYGPVGVDECNNKESKLEFIESSIKQLENLGIEPLISVLSGGRIGDIGRNEKIDKSIRDGEEVVALLKKRYPKLNITHDEILIENAVANKSNLIIAPEGISGNLIYRTLVHLGGGRAYGAIYMVDDQKTHRKIIIDTSRVGKLSEIQGALLLALALS
ncbi:MAG: methanogenesis marker protein Mmp4/MtxX [Promethearchaeota archaeon]